MIEERFTHKSMAQYLGIGESCLRTLMSRGEYDMVFFQGRIFLLTTNNYILLQRALKGKLDSCRPCDVSKYTEALKRLAALKWINKKQENPKRF